MTTTERREGHMEAIVQDAYGAGPEQVLRLDSVATPPIGDDDILVRVRAASVDRCTWHVMAGLPYPIRAAGFGLRRPRYGNPGRSLAGTVAVVGSTVTDLAPGDEVFGIGDATFAEYARAPAGKLARKPSNLTFEHACAVPVSGLAALQAVRDHGWVRAGQQVLVVGASGGVGSFAVQIAKALAVLRDLIESGAITVPVDRIYPLSETADAIRRLLDGRARGKVLITI